MVTVIGLDLSLTATGVSDGTSTWVVKSRGHKGDDLATRQRRLDEIRLAVLQRCDGADLVVIEQPAYSRQTGHMHDRSGLWWLVVADLLGLGQAVAEVSPTGVKKYATGKGNAGKGQLIDAVARRFPDIDTGNGDDNRCDALWLAAMGHDHLGQPLCPVPATHRTALASVAWPPLEAAA